MEKRQTHRTLLKRMKSVLASSQAFHGVSRVLVGVSGGIDSTVLLHLLSSLRKEGGPEVVAAHVHHGLRGEEADRDAVLAEKTALQHKCSFHVIHLRRHVAGIGTEHKLRELRLSALEKLTTRLKAQRVVLGHQKDDQAETILLRLLGGSDLRGLGGIRIYRPPLWVHPLLHISREEIFHEAERCGLTYGEDSTNRVTHMRRNFLRQNVIPMLKAQFNPKLTQHLCALAQSMDLFTGYLDEEASHLLRKAESGDGSIYVGPLKEAPEAVRYAALQLAYRLIAGEGTSLQRRQLRVVDHLVNVGGEMRTFALPHNVFVIRQDDRLKFTKIN